MLIRRSRVRDDRGSVLMLMPALFLIMLVLAAIAVDLTAVRVRQRTFLAAITDAANDAVTVGLDEDAFRAGAGYRLDPSRVRNVVFATLAARGVADHLTAAPEVIIDPAGTVTIRAVGRVDHIFSGALPGTPRTTSVHAEVTATAQQR